MQEEKKDYKSLILPKDQLPECWNDEMRMGFMCAPIIAKTVNRDYESKIKFWSEMIHIWCKHFKISSFTLEDLNSVFKWNGIVPRCLPFVIDELDKNGVLTKQSEFLEPSTSQSWALWSINIFVKKPLKWTFNKVKDSLYNPSPTNNLQCVYVHNRIVEEQAKILEDSIKEENRDKILSLDEIVNLSGLEDVQMALYLLYKQNKVDLQTSPDKKKILIKFYSESQKIISPIDLGIYTLRTNEKSLLKNIENLEFEKEELRNEAKSYLSKGSRQMAKNCLRKKKAIDHCIEKRAVALENIQSLLDKIREAETDALVVEAYQYGLEALRKTFDEAGLNEESASTVMDNVKETVVMADEISQEIATSISEGTDAEFEAELETLMKDIETTPTKSKPVLDDPETLVNRFEKLRFDLPSPPKDLPGSSKVNKEPLKIKIHN